MTAELDTVQTCRLRMEVMDLTQNLQVKRFSQTNSG